MHNRLLDRICADFRRILGSNLVGFYVHGSIAFGCFRWETSDVDFLAVAEQPLSHDEKTALIRAILAHTPDAPPKGIEMSVVLKEHTQHFVYPTPFELHFSNAYLRQYTEDADGMCKNLHGADPDLAAHFAVTRKTGLCLYGAPIDEIFASVPRAAMLDSLLLDCGDSADMLMQNPVYFALNLCRAIAFREQNLILSKAGGGEWALAHLPEEYHPAIRSALNAYVSGTPANRDIIENFRDYALGRVRKPRTLYVSDLDGTLLGKGVKTSAYTNNAVNRLVNRGMVFTYATARSYYSSSKVAAGLNASFPVILYNGAIILDNATGERLLTNFFTSEEVSHIRSLLSGAGVSPIVYAFIDGRERFSIHPEETSKGVRAYAETRDGDARTRIIHSEDELYTGEVFYFTCIGDGLKPLYDALKDNFHCVYQIDLYDGLPWLEIMPKAATKANAALQLKEHLFCDRIVAFGDGINDAELFEIADEAYAVSNAAESLKALATKVIGSNEEDAVAKHLESIYK